MLATFTSRGSAVTPRRGRGRFRVTLALIAGIGQELSRDLIRGKLCARHKWRQQSAIALHGGRTYG